MFCSGPHDILCRTLHSEVTGSPPLSAVLRGRVGPEQEVCTEGGRIAPTNFDIYDGTVILHSNDLRLLRAAHRVYVLEVYHVVLYG